MEKYFRQDASLATVFHMSRNAPSRCDGLKFSRRKVIFSNCSLSLRFCHLKDLGIIAESKWGNMRGFAHQVAQPKKSSWQMETFARLFIIQDCLFLKDYKKDLEKAEREASYSSMSTTSFSFPDFPAAASTESQTPSSISPSSVPTLLSLFTTFPHHLLFSLHVVFFFSNCHNSYKRVVFRRWLSSEPTHFADSCRVW